MAKKQREYIYAVRTVEATGEVEEKRFSRQTWLNMPEGRYGFSEIQKGADADGGLPVAGKPATATLPPAKNTPGGVRPPKPAKVVPVAPETTVFAPEKPNLPADKADVNA